MQVAPLYSDISTCPDDGRAYWIETEDGMRLRVAAWRNHHCPNGTVFLFSGITGFIERNGRGASSLAERGYASFAVDWRGHGLSDRLTANRQTLHVKAFGDYQKDVVAAVEAASDLDLPKPWFLLANSMGAAIGFRAMVERRLPVQACGLVAPMWGISMMSLTRLIAWPVSCAAQKSGLGHLYVPGYNDQLYVLKTAFEDNDLTNDPGVYRHLMQMAEARPEIHTSGPSLSWLFEALKECRLLKKMPAPNIPSIIFFGEQDETVEFLPSKARAESWENCQFDCFKGAKHDLLSEVTEIHTKVVSRCVDLFKETSSPSSVA